MSIVEALAEPTRRCIVGLLVERPRAAELGHPLNVVRQVAQHPHTPPAVLESLSHGPIEHFPTRPEHEAHPTWQIVQATLRHPALPPRALEQHARSPHLLVRCRIAERPDCPAPVLDVLATDPHRSVLERVLRHPQASEAIRGKAHLCLSFEHSA